VSKMHPVKNVLQSGAGRTCPETKPRGRCTSLIRNRIIKLGLSPTTNETNDVPGERKENNENGTEKPQIGTLLEGERDKDEG